MKQTARILSTYASDTSGVCSAMFELGGMTVMHDASGCNSTYNTHDEPRWYDFDSLVFISGLTEMEAMLGDEQKLIDDTIRAAQEFSPSFISLAGSPIPAMTGIDLPAIAQQIEKQIRIPVFGFPTDGMHSYVSGASMALAAIARRLCREDVSKRSGVAVNVLGMTPLDFSIHGMEQSIREILEANGMSVVSVWAMGSQLEEIQRAGEAAVNLVVSSCGLAAAKILQQRFGTPYVVGTPCGEQFTQELMEALKKAAAAQQSAVVCQPHGDENILVIGESVTARSLAHALWLETGRGAKVLCPIDAESELLSDCCISAWDEDELIPYLQNASCIIADPMYQPICPDSARFIALPHEGFSGRIYREEIPDLLHHFDRLKKEIEK